MKEEIWRDAVGYEGYYQVSNLGRVRSLDRYVNHWPHGEQLIKSRLLKQNNDGRGYNVVTLCKNGTKTTHRVHRLVAEAFIPNPNAYPCINHKDEDKTNNMADNLEYCTVKYNSNYGTRNNRLGEKLTNRPDESKSVLQFTLDGEFVNEYPSMAEAQRQTGIDSGNISSCCRGDRYKSTGGYIWKYNC